MKDEHTLGSQKTSYNGHLHRDIRFKTVFTSDSPFVDEECMIQTHKDLDDSTLVVPNL